MTLAEQLRPHVAAIKTAAANGDKKAQQIIDLYQMHVSCPFDPAAPVFCEEAFQEWLAGNEGGYA